MEDQLTPGQLNHQPRALKTKHRLHVPNEYSFHVLRTGVLKVWLLSGGEKETVREKGDRCKDDRKHERKHLLHCNLCFYRSL